ILVARQLRVHVLDSRDRDRQVRAPAGDRRADVRPQDQRADRARHPRGEGQVVRARLRKIWEVARSRRLRWPRRIAASLAALWLVATIAWHIAIRAGEFPRELLAKDTASSLTVVDAGGVMLRQEATSAGTKERWVPLDRIS